MCATCVWNFLIVVAMVSLMPSLLGQCFLIVSTTLNSSLVFGVNLSFTLSSSSSWSSPLASLSECQQLPLKREWLCMPKMIFGVFMSVRCILRLPETQERVCSIFTKLRDVFGISTKWELKKVLKHGVERNLILCEIREGLIASLTRWRFLLDFF